MYALAVSHDTFVVVDLMAVHEMHLLQLILKKKGVGTSDS